MSKQNKSLLLPILLTILAGSAVFGSLAGLTRAKSFGMEPATLPVTKTSSLTHGPATPTGQRLAPRNLSLQPEAFKLSRKLGQRFASSRREVSVMIGTLITGVERQLIHMLRKQDDRGERVEIGIGGGPPSMIWSHQEGSKSSNRAASESERVLIERLAFDSIDQFVLAQLRGASYYTIARNVMPAEAGGAEDYSGPTWDIIRVDDPEADPQKRPLSKWRLFYLNSRTGLIDKVISEVHGERIETNFADWTDDAGEKFPRRITWTRQGQTIMEFRLISFAHNSPQQ